MCLVFIRNLSFVFGDFSCNAIDGIFYHVEGAKVEKNLEPTVEKLRERLGLEGGTRFSVGDERKEIVVKAKADGTYMKAPNGKPTKLNERQWVLVRTKKFKNWFGDWEKAARIEKLGKVDKK